jgi:hypothetical protein
MNAAAMFVGITGAILLLSGCTTAYQNAQACKQKMVATYPSNLPELDYQIPRTAIHGTRVVVEATYPYRLPTPIGATPIKITQVDMPAAVQCEFRGNTMTTFAWLAPAAMNTRYPLPKADANSEGD